MLSVHVEGIVLSLAAILCGVSLLGWVHASRTGMSPKEKTQWGMVFVGSLFMFASVVTWERVMPVICPDQGFPSFLAFFCIMGSLFVSLVLLFRGYLAMDTRAVIMGGRALVALVIGACCALIATHL